MSDIYACSKGLEVEARQQFKSMHILGYSEDEFGYRVLDLLDKKVMRSRDIMFLEDKTIEDWKQ